MPSPERIVAVKQTFESCPKRFVATKVIVIMTFLALILTLNNFMFNCKNYLQISGCTMETACTPRYANIFMARLTTEKHIYPFVKIKVELYLRYIDDIFFICKDTEEELKNLFNEINKNHSFIKFDQKYSKSE